MKLALIFSLLSISQIAYCFDHSYQSWAKVLSSYVVTSGATTKVRYLALKEKPQDLEQFLAAVSKLTATEYSSFSREQKLAFLFNSYNAFTLRHILNHHSRENQLKSIKDIGSLFKNSWKIKFFTFLGEESHLDHLEQELARPQFDEPRMHMAFNCASKGCPSLLTEPFVAEKLEQQLDRVTRNFLSDKDRNLYDEKSNSLQISSIFKWYKEDFEKNKQWGSLNNFLASHMALSEGTKAALLAGKVNVKYLEYDWTLNSAD